MEHYYHAWKSLTIPYYSTSYQPSMFIAINITLIIDHSFKLFICIVYSLAIGIVHLHRCQRFKYFLVFSCSLLWSSTWNSHIINDSLGKLSISMMLFLYTRFYHLGFTTFCLRSNLSNNALKIHFLSPLYQECRTLCVHQMDSYKTPGTNKSGKEIVIAGGCMISTCVNLMGE